MGGTITLRAFPDMVVMMALGYFRSQFGFDRPI